MSWKEEIKKQNNLEDIIQALSEFIQGFNADKQQTILLLQNNPHMRDRINRKLANVDKRISEMTKVINQLQEMNRNQ